ncbi:hypothetical protein GCM10028807_57960 [Spirosoma daeguense]
MTEMQHFTNLKLIHEHPTIIGGKWPVRIYTTDSGEGKVRYHLGFLKDWLHDMVWTIAETEPYLGEKHWKEEDGFYIFWLSVCEKPTATPPFEKLQNNLAQMIRHINSAQAFIREASNS